MTQLTDQRVRSLSVDDLGIELPPDSEGSSAGGSGASSNELSPLPDSDPLLQTTRYLVDRYGGVILVGPPGTSKTWSAERLAVSLAGSSTRVRKVQFHPSYQYEDFVEGYVPTGDGGFALQRKHLLLMAADAAEQPQFAFVLVIDELSRGDAARIFGEGLTYVEKSKRGEEFYLASGEPVSIPPNLIFIATMNQLDRGVDDVDAAFERRFGKIAMDPDPVTLNALLEDAGMSQQLRQRVLAFFASVNGKSSDAPQTAIGHTFFQGISSEEDLRVLWDHQLRFFFAKAYRLDPRGYEEVDRGWKGLFRAESTGASGQT